MLLLIAFLFLPLTLAAVGKLKERTASSCEDVHLFLARGDGEDYPGRVGGLEQIVCAGLSSCDYENILFTTTANGLYCPSVAEGVSNGIAQITAYNSLCPDAALVLGGYSLGAHVVGDILGGGGGYFYNCAEASNAPLGPSTSAGSKSKCAQETIVEN